MFHVIIACILFEHKSNDSILYYLFVGLNLPHVVQNSQVGEQGELSMESRSAEFVSTRYRRSLCNWIYFSHRYRIQNILPTKRHVNSRENLICYQSDNGEKIEQYNEYK